MNDLDDEQKFKFCEKVKSFGPSIESISSIEIYSEKREKALVELCKQKRSLFIVSTSHA